MDGSTGHTEHRPEDGPLHQDQNSHTPRTCPEKEERHWLSQLPKARFRKTPNTLPLKTKQMKSNKIRSCLISFFCRIGIPAYCQTFCQVCLSHTKVFIFLKKRFCKRLACWCAGPCRATCCSCLLSPGGSVKICGTTHNLGCSCYCLCSCHSFSLATEVQNKDVTIYICNNILF